ELFGMRAARATSARLIWSRSRCPSRARAAASRRLRRMMPGARNEAFCSRRTVMRDLPRNAGSYPVLSIQECGTIRKPQVDTCRDVHDTRLRSTKLAEEAAGRKHE